MKLLNSSDDDGCRICGDDTVTDKSEFCDTHFVVEDSDLVKT